MANTKKGGSNQNKKSASAKSSSNQGNQGRRLSEETKAKISKALMGNQNARKS